MYVVVFAAIGCMGWWVVGNFLASLTIYDERRKISLSSTTSDAAYVDTAASAATSSSDGVLRGRPPNSSLTRATADQKIPEETSIAHDRQQQEEEQSGISTTATTATITTTKPKAVETTYYALARQDRGGSAIMHMILAHAWTFRHSVKYGGACFLPITVKPHIRQAFVKHKPQHEKLIDGLGLSNVFQFACPSPSSSSLYDEEDGKGEKKKKKKKNHNFIPNVDLENRTFVETELLTPDYLDYLHSLVRYRRPRQKDDDDDEYRIAVHVRREDIKPCGKWSHRYLPNDYYLRQIEAHMPPPSEQQKKKATVTIYSTSHNPSEPFDDFVERNYTLKLDGDDVETWHELMSADVFITSRSGYSHVPALLAKTKTGGAAATGGATYDNDKVNDTNRKGGGSRTTVIVVSSNDYFKVPHGKGVYDDQRYDVRTMFDCDNRKQQKNKTTTEIATTKEY